MSGWQEPPPWEPGNGSARRQPTNWLPSASPRLRLTPWPVSAITSIHDDQRGGNVAYDSGSLVSSADYELDGPAGRVYLLPVRTFGSFSRSSFFSPAVRIAPPEVTRNRLDRSYDFFSS